MRPSGRNAAPSGNIQFAAWPSTLCGLNFLILYAAGKAKGGSCLSEIQRMQRERDERRRNAEERKQERLQEEKR